MKVSPVVVWFRQDLRMADNPALHAAFSSKQPVLPVYIHNTLDSKWSPGRGSTWWLRRSLQELDAQLRTAGSRLVIRSGKAESVLERLADELEVKQVFYNRRYDPPGMREQTGAERRLTGKGITVESFNASLLYEPELIRKRNGEPYKMFTPFWNACLDSPLPAEPIPAPKRIASPSPWPSGERIEQLGLDTDEPDAQNWGMHWNPGPETAAKMLKSFAAGRIGNYEIDRDRPDVTGTSRLSPYLHFGEIGPRQIRAGIQQSASAKTSRAGDRNASAYLRQLGWREFAHYLLYHFPFTTDKPLRSEYENFPWKNNTRLFAAWQEGRTGYPLVDAGMRELAHSGWMHNRVRMIAASFLVKHLLIPWQRGAQWFWDRLVDADPANNTLGWQWVAGCGADAAPFFRIFNPVMQGVKFDPEGLYVRKWVPELSGLPNRWIHCPWEAPAAVLAKGKVKLGRSYPFPIVDHGAARQRALKAYDDIRTKK